MQYIKNTAFLFYCNRFISVNWSLHDL